MSIKHKVGRAGRSKRTPGSPVPDHVNVTQKEWSRLDDESRQFIREAEAGGMRYLAEKGEVCAWGPAVAGIFTVSVDVKNQKNSTGEYLVTLANKDSATSR